MRFIFSSNVLTSKPSKDFENLELFTFENFHLLCDDHNTIVETSEYVSIIDGYLSDIELKDSMERKISAIDSTYKNWPIPDNITGSFAVLIFNKKQSEVVITSDLINIYPLYYLRTSDTLYISNSLILIGRYSKAEFDYTGIFQRAVGPNFMNIGSRTILKNCKCLLPGEWTKFSLKGVVIDRKFDNSLYQNISPKKISKGQIEKYWSHFKKEVELCTLEYPSVNIALSGGVDSRVVFGAIPKSKNIKAHTFGKEKNYETKVAKKLSKIRNATHTAYFDPHQFFPIKEILLKYTKQTEGLKLNSWLEFLENVTPNNKEPLLLGELCEGLPGRNIKTFNSTEFRKKNFYKYYVKKEEFPLTTIDKFSFQEWKKNKRSYILSWHIDFWFEALDLIELKESIIESTLEDLQEIFDRIEAHKLPYFELYDELFSWYTFTRKELSKQVNICNHKFYAFSPGMSLQMLKKTSNIHPNLRLYYRFANKLFKETNELKDLAKIPTNQIPLAPQNWPDLIRIPIWGIRSRIDDMLIKRMMTSKDLTKRYRLFESTNWAGIYQQKNVLKNMSEYYSDNKLTQTYFEKFYELTKRRKNLDSWPFANMDIISGAALNAELNLIKKGF